MSSPRHLRRLFCRFRDKRDARALTELFDATAPDLMALASHLVREADAAEDLVQTTFLVAIERATAYDADRDIYPWLAGILINKARRWNERTGRDLEGTRLTERRGEDDPAAVAGALEVSEILRHAVEELPETYRVVLAPYLANGELPRVIAARLGLAPGTVRMRIHRGLDQLRKALPTGIAAGNMAAFLPLRGLDEVRSTVFQHALLSGKVTASAVPQVSLTVVLAASLALAGGAWMVASVGDDGGAASGSGERMASAPDPEDDGSIDPGGQAPERPDAGEGPAPESTPEGPTPSPTTPVADGDSKPVSTRAVSSPAAPVVRRGSEPTPVAPTRSLPGGPLLPAPPGMKLVPGGRTFVGSTREDVVALIEQDPNLENLERALFAETPQRRVHVADFFVSPYELTKEQYQRFLLATGHEPPAFWEDGVLPASALEPVINVSYSDAVAYCRWAGLRLPTEEEFQRAGRADTRNDYPWGMAAGDSRYANTLTDSRRSEPSPVGSFPMGVSHYGLHDLAGNVWEWTSSPYLPYPGYVDSEVAEVWDAGLRVVVGGSCLNDRVAARLATRRPAPREHLTDALGFRPAATARGVGFDAALAHSKSVPDGDGARTYAPELVVGMDRWKTRVPQGVGAPEGYAVIDRYDYVLFVPVDQLGDYQDVTFRKGSEVAPVHVGILSTSIPLLAPELAAGTYLITCSFEGGYTPKDVFTFLDPRNGEAMGRVEAPSASFGKGDAGGEIEYVGAGAGRRRVLIEARIRTRIRKRVWPVRLAFDVAADSISGTWRR